MMIFAIAALCLTMAACNGKKAEQPQTATTEVAVVTDTAFQNKAAGDYQSYDGSKVITLNSDLTVTTKNTQDYYKWELIAKPEGDQTIILLDRKGVDKIPLLSAEQSPLHMELLSSAMLHRQNIYAFLRWKM